MQYQSEVIFNTEIKDYNIPLGIKKEHSNINHKKKNLSFCCSFQLNYYDKPTKSLITV